jgi:two-component system LytT family response regulator
VAEIRALIVDDEPLARRGVRQLLAAYPDVRVAAECRNGTEALTALASREVDLVFLDVQMPGLDGLSVIRLHGLERMPQTVFVTAHDAYAVEAFETQALDYLVKPLSEARFRATMTRVRERLRLAGAAERAARLSALLGAAGKEERPRTAGRIAVTQDGCTRLISPDDIEWIVADDYYVRIRAAGREYRLRETLSSLEARLDPGLFRRVHRAVMVRLDLVRELAALPGGEAVVRLKDGTELPVSRRRLRETRRRLRSS